MTSSYAERVKKAAVFALAALAVAMLSMFAVSQTALADDDSEATGSDDVVFTVYEAAYPGADTEVVKEYTAAEFEALITDQDTTTYCIFVKSNAVNVRAANKYASIDDILEDAGIAIDRSTSLEIGCLDANDYFTATFTYAQYEDSQYFYPNVTASDQSDLNDAVSGLPIAITDVYGSASSSTDTASAVAKSALASIAENGSYQLIVPQNSSCGYAGRVQVSGVDGIIISNAFGRIGGTTRLDTMAQIVEAAFDNAGNVYSKNIIVCSSENYPDALAAAGYAGLDFSEGKYTKATPIVLTSSDELSDQAAEEITTILDNTASCADAADKDDPVTITIVGGTASVSEDVEAQIQELIDDYYATDDSDDDADDSTVETTDDGTTDGSTDGAESEDETASATVTRICGSDRVATALALYNDVSEEDDVSWSNTAYVVSGGSYADALSAGSAAYYNQSPIFLTDSNGELTSSLIIALSKAEANGTIDNVVVLGGTASVSEETFDTLAEIFDGSVTESTETELAEGTIETSGSGNVVRIYGTSRYKTSSTFAEYAVTNLDLSYETIVVATGASYPDALAAAPFAGFYDAPILLVDDSDSATPCISVNIASNAESISTGFVVGGTASVSEDMYDQIVEIIYGSSDAE